MQVMAMEGNEFAKFFWQEQMRLMNSNKYGRRYHPLFIKWCIHLYFRLGGNNFFPLRITLSNHVLFLNFKTCFPASGFEKLSEAGVFVLPSQQRIRDLTKHFAREQGRGLNKKILH